MPCGTARKKTLPPGTSISPRMRFETKNSVTRGDATPEILQAICNESIEAQLSKQTEEVSHLKSGPRRVWKARQDDDKDER